MTALEDLQLMREEERGGEDAPSEYAYSNMETMLKAVIAFPQPSLAPFEDAVIAQWNQDGHKRVIRLHCAGKPEERSYIFWRDKEENLSGIEDVDAELLVKRLQWLAGHISHQE